MNTPVPTMAAGSWFGIMPEVNRIPIPVGKKVFGPSSAVDRSWIAAQDVQVSKKQFVNRCKQTSYWLIPMIPKV